MSYNKQTWTDGDTPLDASHMNHIEDGIESVDTAISNLSSVATSGDYDDLINKPTIPSVPNIVNTHSTSTSDVYSANQTNSEITSHIKTSNTTSDNDTYSCTYVNNRIKTSRNTGTGDTYSCSYVNGLIKTSNTTSDNNTYSCTYIDNTFEKKGVTLYSSSSGTDGDVSLSDNPTKYSFLVVKHKNNDLGTIYSEVIVKPVIDQIVAFTRVEVTSNEAYLFEKNFTIKSNKLQGGSAYLHGLHNNSYANYNNLVVLEVIGYK